MACKLRLLLLLVLLTLGTDAFAVITRGATVSTCTHTSGATACNITHTVDSGTTILIVYIGIEGNESVSGTPQWSLGGGENLTLIRKFGASSNAADAIGYFYGLISPTAGAGTVTIAITDTADPIYTAAVNYIGTTGSAVFLSEDINDNNTTTSVHASAGNSGNALVFGGHFQGNDGNPTSNATSFVEVIENTTGGTAGSDFAFYWADILNASGATAITVTWSALDENTSAYIELVAVGGGGAGSLRRRRSK